MRIHKDVKKLINLAVDHGWVVEYTTKGHIKLKSPDGQHLLVIGPHSSANRNLKNATAMVLRVIGGGQP